MCQNVPPLEIYDEEMFNCLPPTWQHAIARMCVRLHKHGDGQLSDEWLLKRIFTNRKRVAEFRALIIALGWFRDEGGNLCRAGILAPSEDAPAADQHHKADDADRSIVAIRKQIERDVKRAVAAELAVLGLGRGTTAGHSAPINTTNAGGNEAQTPSQSLEQAGQMSGGAPSPSRARPASPTDLQTDSPTDGVTDRQSVGQTAPPPILTMDSAYPIDDNDPQDIKLVAALTEAGNPPDVIRMVVSRIPPGDRFKIAMARRFAQNIVKNRAAEALAQMKKTKSFDDPMLGAVPGGAAPDPAPSACASPAAGSAASPVKGTGAAYIARERKAGRL